jgi:hypothetical protein
MFSGQYCAAPRRLAPAGSPDNASGCRFSRHSRAARKPAVPTPAARCRCQHRQSARFRRHSAVVRIAEQQPYYPALGLGEEGIRHAGLFLRSHFGNDHSQNGYRQLPFYRSSAYWSPRAQAIRFVTGWIWLLCWMRRSSRHCSIVSAVTEESSKCSAGRLGRTFLRSPTPPGKAGAMRYRWSVGLHFIRPNLRGLSHCRTRGQRDDAAVLHRSNDAVGQYVDMWPEQWRYLKAHASKNAVLPARPPWMAEVPETQEQFSGRPPWMVEGTNLQLGEVDRARMPMSGETDMSP